LNPTPEKIETQLDRLLLHVEKPGRYTGGELNQVVKEWNNISTKVALVFPDIYDLGMSNLGLTILYDIINQRNDTLAERAYAPWLDMEAQMRAAGLPLYSLETKHALADFDILGFSLPYETLYTNTLNLLDLAQIPLFYSERNESQPLVIAGGQTTFNPEPMAPFIDAFVIGEGEEVIHEIIDAHQAWKNRGGSRGELLTGLGKIEGVYVPSLYEAHYNSDGTLSEVKKSVEELPLPVKKRIVVKLPPPPTRFIVPYIDTVHNRITIEIMRGCSRGCRFCHAGMVSRPVRERPVQEIIQAIQDSLHQTGLEEAGLLSLSSSDYSQIKELLSSLADLQSSVEFNSQRVSISLPSLRIESFTEDVMDGLQDTKRHGYTLAPEAASERLREIINKPISTPQLLQTVQEIYKRGMTTIKLYFMIGHPGETMEDVQAIADLCKAVFVEGRKVMGGRAQVNVGVSTFAPKPHTPFQWVSLDSSENIQAKQSLLRHELRQRNIKLSWNAAEETLLEATLSRGDRRLAAVIYRAWQNGAKFDAWQDQFKYNIWTDAFAQENLDPDFYARRERADDEVFPWDHIFAGVRKKFLLQDYHWSREGRLRADCRLDCYGCGIMPVYADAYRSASAEDGLGASWKCKEVK